MGWARTRTFRIPRAAGVPSPSLDDGIPHVLDDCGVRGVPLHLWGRGRDAGAEPGDVLVQEGAHLFAVGKGVPLGVQRLRQPKHLRQPQRARHSEQPGTANPRRMAGMQARRDSRPRG